MEQIWKEIIRGVNSTPTMVFSVIGDSKSNVSRPTSVFKTALIEAAKSGGGMMLYICLHSSMFVYLVFVTYL